MSIIVGVFFFFKSLYTCIIEHETYGTSWMKTSLVNDSKTIHEVILLNSVSFPQKLLSVVLTTCNFLCVSLKICANYPLNTNKVLSNYRCYSNFWNVGSIVWSKKKKKCLRNFKVGQGRNRFLYFSIQLWTVTKIFKEFVIGFLDIHWVKFFKFLRIFELFLVGVFFFLPNFDLL